MALLWQDGRKWPVSGNGRYLVHDLDNDAAEKENEKDGGAFDVFDVLDTVAALLIDCTGTFSIQEHDGRGEAYVGHCGISIALYELTSQWCVAVPEQQRQQRRTLDANEFPDWRTHFGSNHLSLTNFSRRRYTLLEGHSVYFVLRALSTGGEDGLDDLERIGSTLVLTAPADDCELLYGRTGFLHGLMLLRRRLGRPTLFADLVVRLVKQVLDNGLHGDALMWTWHGKQYLGAVHGVAGICYMLLCCAAEALALYDNVFQLLSNTVDRVLSTYAHQPPPDAGDTAACCNVFPTAREGGSDDLVHFCHGATGWVPMLLLMSVVYEPRDAAQATAYRAAAERCGETVWRRGLLVTKGPGLCHGVGGSICALVDLYTCTGDAKWLWRAQQFSIVLVRLLARVAPLADRKLSLYEGKGGALYALAVVQALSDHAAPCGGPNNTHPRMRRGPGQDWQSCFPGLGV